jgi:hypothetical protein
MKEQYVDFKYDNFVLHSQKLRWYNLDIGILSYRIISKSEYFWMFLFHSLLPFTIRRKTSGQWKTNKYLDNGK